MSRFHDFEIRTRDREEKIETGESSYSCYCFCLAVIVVIVSDLPRYIYCCFYFHCCFCFVVIVVIVSGPARYIFRGKGTAVQPVSPSIKYSDPSLLHPSHNHLIPSHIFSHLFNFSSITKLSLLIYLLTLELYLVVFFYFLIIKLPITL